MTEAFFGTLLIYVSLLVVAQGTAFLKKLF